jgi:hypothetical protein
MRRGLERWPLMEKEEFPGSVTIEGGIGIFDQTRCANAMNAA